MDNQYAVSQNLKIKKATRCTCTLNITGTMSDSKMNGRIKVTFTVILLLLFSGMLGIIAWQVEEHRSSKTQPNNYQSSAELTLGAMKLNKDNMSVRIVDSKSTSNRLTGKLFVNRSVNTTGTDCGSDSTKICMNWANDRNVQITYKAFGTVDCYFFEWITLRCESQVLMDCFDLAGAHWYGGYEDWNQYWPLEQTSMNTNAFLANDSYQKLLGGVQERYFINTQGIGFNVSDDVPLFLSINKSSDGKMCFTAKYDKYPYTNTHRSPPKLMYKICTADNVRQIHDFMSASLPNPSDIPDKDLFRYPIWSTWAQYHKDINQSTVLEFAYNILKYKFGHSQLEIDDDWTPKYGDMDFTAKKFENASDMIKQLNKMGFRVTIWVHPFFNIDSQAFLEAGVLGFLVRQYDSLLPALVSWWDGNAAGILDVSNENATTWYLNKLRNLRTTYNISSFKFDAGECNWLPNIFANPFDSPNFYPTKWAELAYNADKNVRHQEVRVGVNTQNLPIFVRMLDKDSNWDYRNGLKTLINTALTFGILGYPFILPDMIGGNAYEGHIPERELFIRWLEATALLPSMQFSIVPWQYDEEVINISIKFTKMHEKYSDLIIELAQESVRTGAPIIRPIWWVAPDDEEAQVIDSEFLLGNNILVAPVLQKNARSRNIYLPAGRWNSTTNGTIFDGPILVQNFPAALDELPVFERVTAN